MTTHQQGLNLAACFWRSRCWVNTTLLFHKGAKVQQNPSCCFSLLLHNAQWKEPSLEILYHHHGLTHFVKVFKEAASSVLISQQSDRGHCLMTSAERAPRPACGDARCCYQQEFIRRAQSQCAWLVRKPFLSAASRTKRGKSSHRSERKWGARTAVRGRALSGTCLGAWARCRAAWCPRVGQTPWQSALQHTQQGRRAGSCETQGSTDLSSYQETLGFRRLF